MTGFVEFGAETTFVDREVNQLSTDTFHANESVMDLTQFASLTEIQDVIKSVQTHSDLGQNEEPVTDLTKLGTLVLVDGSIDFLNKNGVENKVDVALENKNQSFSSITDLTNFGSFSSIQNALKGIENSVVEENDFLEEMEVSGLDEMLNGIKGALLSLASGADFNDTFEASDEEEIYTVSDALKSLAENKN